MTRTLKVKAAVPFPISRDRAVMYYAFEEDQELEVGQVVHLDEPEVPEPNPEEDVFCLDQIETRRDLGFYDLGVSETMNALAQLLEGGSRDGVSQRRWQMLKEQIWQLQDLQETCKDLEKVEACSDRWWYRIDGDTGKVVLFQLSGQEREIFVGGSFGANEEEERFAKRIATTINLTQEIQSCLRARSMAQDLFQIIRSREASRSQDNPSTTEE